MHDYSVHVIVDVLVIVSQVLSDLGGLPGYFSSKSTTHLVLDTLLLFSILSPIFLTSPHCIPSLSAIIFPHTPALPISCSVVSSLFSLLFVPTHLYPPWCSLFNISIFLPLPPSSLSPSFPPSIPPSPLMCSSLR